MTSSIRSYWSLLAIAAVLSFALAVPSTVHAFSVSPVLVDQTMDPGSFVQGKFHIMNDTKSDQTYYASVQNFIAQGEEGEQTFLPDTDTTGLVSWITLDQKSITLKPGQTNDFAWAVHVPKDGEPGGHYAAVFFSNLPPETEGQSSIGVGAKTGVLFLVNVRGNIQEAASVASFRLLNDRNADTNAKGISYLDHLPATFESCIQNGGNVHFTLNGKISVANMFGSKVAEIPANPNGAHVLPNSIRRILSSWGPDISEGKGFWSGLSAEWKGFAIGRYTAELHGTYGSTNQPLTASVAFWIIPWRLLIVFLLGLIALILLLKGYNALIIKSATSKTKK